jgi:5'-nucleotidase
MLPFKACQPAEVHVLLAVGLGRFMEVSEPKGPHLPEIDEHTPNLRLFRNFAGYARE